MSRRAAGPVLGVLLRLIASVVSAGVLAGCGGGPTLPPTTYAGCHLVPGTSCPKVKLTGVDLSYMDLHGANFAGAVFGEVNLTGADLRGANLQGAAFAFSFLHATDFTGADLSHAIFNTVDAGQAVLTSAQLEGTYQCTFVLPDGALSNLNCPVSAPRGLPKISGTPRITKLAPTKPVECADDLRGTTVQVDYKAEHYAVLQLFSDDVLVARPVFGSGTIVVPFECDGTPHTIELTATGAGTTITKVLTLTLKPVTLAAPR